MTNVTLNDAVFGTHRITEPVLIDLLNSRAVLRLQGIHQAGASYMVRSGRDNIRYDHIVGVMLLIRMLNGSLPEQIAGLIHDVSHTAFSHVIDQVYGIQDEDYHERLFDRLVMASDIPDIIQRHGLKIEDVLDSGRWTLLDRNMPDLCADRIDYTLRDLLRMQIITAEEIRHFLKSLIVDDGLIACSNIESAIWFVQQYTTEVHDLFMNPLEIYANEQMANAIRIALNRNLLPIDVMLLQDEDVLDALRRSGDPDIVRCLSRLNHSMIVVEDRELFDVRSYPKARIIDPLVRMPNGLLRRCSDIYPEVLHMHETVRNRAKNGICARAVVDGSSGALPAGP